MGSVHIKNGRFQGRFRDHEGGQHSKSFDTRAEALNWITVNEADVARGIYFDVNRGRMTVGALALEWLPLLQGSPSYQARIRSNFYCHILPVLGPVPFNHLSSMKAKAFLKSIEGLKPGTRKLVVSHLLRLLATAVRENRLHPQQYDHLRVDLTQIDRGDEDESLYRPLLPDEVRRLIPAMPTHLRVAVEVGAWTGLRAGEMTGLTVDRINFLRNSIRIDRQLKVHPDGQVYLGPLKTPAARRDLDVDPMVIEAVSRHLARFPVQEKEILVSTDNRRFKAERVGLIILGERGGPFRPSNLPTVVGEAAVSVGIDRAIVFHSLRHHFASLALAHGWPIPELQRYLGHSSPAVTLNVYSHFIPPSTPRRLISAVYGAVDHLCTGEADDEGEEQVRRVDGLG
jgi:integrase